MAEKKITKREMFEQIKAKYNLDEAEVKFIDHELELLAKKNTSDKKPTAQQEANNGIKEAILDYMVEGTQYTITDLLKGCDECKELSNQRVSALMRQLYNDGKVDRVEDKRKTYFVLVVGD
jgi:predicted transcriptional regulator